MLFRSAAQAPVLAQASANPLVAAGGPSRKTQTTKRTSARATNAVGGDDAARLPGSLSVFSRIPVEVFADGRRVGSSDGEQILLTAGRHQIELVSERFLYRAQAAVTVKSGNVTPYNVTLPDGAVRVITADGAEIWIEGQRVGVAPMSAVSVPIGTREVVVKSPEFGERRGTLEVRYGQVSEIMLMPQVSGSNTPPKLAPLSGGRTQFVH